jgi:septum formation protein
VEFRVVAPRAEEGPDPLANARAKAREVAARAGVPEGGAVLGADTEVLLDGRALGKPSDTAVARRELRALSRRTHLVRSAVCVIMQRGEREAVEDAHVTFRELSEAAIDRYVATGEWRDRAGGYAIQGAGAALVERIEGDYTAVVGLPVGRLAAMLEELGLLP